MVLVIDGIIIVLLVLFAAGGIRRGVWPEVVTLGGLLLGALLAAEWGDVWGDDLAGMVGAFGPVGSRMIVRSLLLLLPLLIVGYGGSLLLPARGAPGARNRSLGGVLGLFNGLAITALLLRNWHISQGTASTPLTEDAFTGVMLVWAGWWPLLLAAGAAVAVLVAFLRRPRPVPAAKPTPTLPALAGTGSPGTSSPALDASAGATPDKASSGPFDGVRNNPPTAAGPVPVPITPRPATTAAGSTTGTNKERYCRTCSKLLAPGAAFCPNCGSPVEA